MLPSVALDVVDYLGVGIRVLPHLPKTVHPRFAARGTLGADHRQEWAGTAILRPMPTAVIYCRVSSEDQIERNALNLPTQERKCHRHCEHNQWSVLRVVTDAGESGRTADRPQLQEM